MNVGTVAVGPHANGLRFFILWENGTTAEMTCDELQRTIVPAPGEQRPSETDIEAAKNKPELLALLLTARGVEMPAGTGKPRVLQLLRETDGAKVQYGAQCRRPRCSTAMGATYALLASPSALRFSLLKRRRRRSDDALPLMGNSARFGVMRR